jgi:hypothetical protein
VQSRSRRPSTTKSSKPKRPKKPLPSRNYIVYFDRPVWYQRDHPVAARLIRSLNVTSTSPEEATIHAYRMTSGEVRVKKVKEVEYFPAPTPIDDTQPQPPIEINVIQ